MEITYADLLPAQQALNVLSQRNIPARTALKIARISQAIDSEMKPFRQIRESINNQYAEPRKDGDGNILKNRDGSIVPKTREVEEGQQEIVWQSDEAQASAEEEWESLVSQRVELEPPLLDENDLENLGDVSARLLMMIEPFIE